MCRLKNREKRLRLGKFASGIVRNVNQQQYNIINYNNIRVRTQYLLFAVLIWRLLQPADVLQSFVRAYYS